jgi:hypothetical protein
MSNTETYSERVDRIAAELLDVLRDVLGPARRLPEPRADYVGYGDHAVTVRDGEGGRVEVTAHLNDLRLVWRYTAGLTRKGSDGLHRTVVGPLRTDCSEAPEEHPTLTHVLPLVTRLGLCEKRLRRAHRALEVAGHVVERSGPRLVLREARPWGSQAVTIVELDPGNGSLLVRGRDSGEVREVLYQAKVL